MDAFTSLNSYFVQVVSLTSLQSVNDRVMMNFSRAQDKLMEPTITVVEMCFAQLGYFAPIISLLMIINKSQNNQE